MTQQLEHTPGPWWPVKDGWGSWSVKTHRDHSYMTPEEEAEALWPYGAYICMAIGDHTEKRTSGNEEANARLIAAAPETAAERDKLKEINAELLEALTRLLAARELTQASNSQAGFQNACKLMAVAEERAYAAIAKARGQA